MFRVNRKRPSSSPARRPTRISPAPSARAAAAPANEEEWLARSAHVATAREAAEERLRSARRHWESLVGSDADPHEVDELLRVRIRSSSWSEPRRRHRPPCAPSARCTVRRWLAGGWRGRRRVTTSRPSSTSSTSTSSDCSPEAPKRSRPPPAPRGRRPVARGVRNDRPTDRVARPGIVAGARAPRQHGRPAPRRRRSDHRRGGLAVDDDA